MTKKTSYGRIKETTVGGFVMPRSYRKMEEYEEEILRLKSEGKTNREISEKFGFNMKQIKKLHNAIQYPAEETGGRNRKPPQRKTSKGL